MMLFHFSLVSRVWAMMQIYKRFIQQNGSSFMSLVLGLGIASCYLVLSLLLSF
jgi:hypothetical protein